MKTKINRVKSFAAMNWRQKRTSRITPIALAGMLLASTTSLLTAAQLMWDAGNTTNGVSIDPANGTWDLDPANLSWNNGATNVAWTQTAAMTPLHGAIFGGPDGEYAVNIAVPIAFTNMMINASGYTFSGSTLFLLPAGFISVADGKSVTFDMNFVANNAGKYMMLGAGGSPAALIAHGNVTGDQWVFTSTNGSVFYFSGLNNPSVATMNATVMQTNGTWNAGATWQIGRAVASPQPANSTGAVIIDGPATMLNFAAGSSALVGRGGGKGTLTVQNDGTINVGLSAAKNIVLNNDRNGNARGLLNVYGGAVNVGGLSVNSQIQLSPNGSAAGQLAVFNQTGGVINAWGGIIFGAASGTFDGGSAFMTNSGGTLYVGAQGGDGIRRGAVFPPTNSITLTGGTLAALQNWSSSLPMTLDTAHGNITFQCADQFATSLNITLGGTLSGPGGLNKSGPGKLTLTGLNSYAGATVISNGVLQVITGSSASTNGNVILDGAAGTPMLSVKVSNQGQYWSVGSLSFGAGAATIDFQYSQVSPSTSVPALAVNGDVTFSGTPAFVITNASALSAATYPLIRYSGNVIGSTPSAVTLPDTGYASGYITNIASTKTIALVITNSSYTPALVWGVGGGIWDVNTTASWKQNGSLVKFQDDNAITFDDTAAGPDITVTLNSTVTPSDRTFNNLTNNYTITGTGGIAGGTGNLELLGGGTVTLATANTYSGGTVVSAGSKLNINNGGDAGSSAIGTGALTLNPGARLGNTSGTNVTIQAYIPEVWNGNFSFAGPGNLNTGPGAITMNGHVTVAVTNELTVGSVGDNGASYVLTKTGNGTLNLPTGNFFGGGMEIFFGKVNLGDPYSAGTGILTIDNGAIIDNISGSDLTLGVSGYFLSQLPNMGVWTYQGTTNLDLGNVPMIANNASSMYFNIVSNKLIIENDINSGNTRIYKIGKGTFEINGFSGANHSLQMEVDDGVVNLGRSSGFCIGLGGIGLQVISNGVAVITGDSGNQIRDGAGDAPVIVASGGVLDMNGRNEVVNHMTNSNGILRNGMAASASALTIGIATGNVPDPVLALAGTNCVFDVPAADSALSLNGIINGTGTLVKTGSGILNLTSNNTYIGSTMVTAGTLALTDPLGIGAGSISNSALISVSAGATLDLVGRGDQSLFLQPGQTLTGGGGVNGILVTLPGSTVSPGASVGTMIVTNNVDMSNGGTLLIKVSKASAPDHSRLISDLGTVTYGGTLAVSNAGPVLLAGDKFQIFPSAVTSFTGFNLIAADGNKKIYTWDNKIAVDGSIQVMSVTDAVNLNPTNITASVSGNALTLSWPSDHLGWTLQTNSAGLDAVNSWFPYPGSASATNVGININPSAPKVFFRLVYP